MNWYTILKQLKVRPPTALKAIYLYVSFQPKIRRYFFECLI